jgi:hypothetical protein
MADSEEDQKPTDYTGVIILAILTPVYVFFAHIGKTGIGLSVSICLGMILLAIKIRWELRKRIWFWATIVLVLLLHVPMVLRVPWPHMTINRITLLPIGVADLLLTLGAIRFVETFIVKAAPSDREA